MSYQWFIIYPSGNTVQEPSQACKVCAFYVFNFCLPWFEIILVNSCGNSVVQFMGWVISATAVMPFPGTSNVSFIGVVMIDYICFRGQYQNISYVHFIALFVTELILFLKHYWQVLVWCVLETSYSVHQHGGHGFAININNSVSQSEHFNFVTFDIHF